MSTQKLILVVESRENVMGDLQFVLHRAGYVSLAAYDGETALKSFQKRKPALVLLDAALSDGMNGFEVYEALREINQEAEIIMMAAQHETEEALQIGIHRRNLAIKPFPIPLLLAKVKAALDREEPSNELPSAADDAISVVGELTINRDSRQIFLAGEAVGLTAQEYNLLALLIDRPNKVFSREELLREIWHYDSFLEKSSRMVDVLIRRMRRKIEADPAHPVYIPTRRGVGYYLSF